MKILFPLLLLIIGLDLWANPYAEKLPREDFEYLIVATHSFDGQLKALSTDNGALVGGLKNAAKYVRILRQKYGEKVILLHAGSLFKKDNTAAEVEEISNLIKALNYDAILPAETDIVSHKETIDQLVAAGTPILSSNLLEPKSGEFLFQKSLIIKKKYDIQVLGLFSLKHLQEKYLNPYLPGIYVKDEIASALELLEPKNKIKILLGGFNQKCQGTSRSKLLYEWGEDPGCSKQSTISYIMRKLPKDAVDVIINQGGSAAAGYMKNTIISQAQAQGKQISLIGISYFEPHQVFDIKKSYAYLPVEVCKNQVQEGSSCTPKKKGFFARLFSKEEASKKNVSFLNSVISN